MTDQPGWSPTIGQWAAFGRAVYEWHQLAEPRADRPDLAWCRCGQPAVLCAYLGAARRYLGLPMPWDDQPPDPRPSPHPRPS